MASYDNDRLQQLQASYLASRSQHDLNDLFNAMKEATSVILNSMLKKSGLSFNQERREELVEDACYRYLFLRLLIKDPKYSLLGMELKYQLVYFLHNSNQKRRDKIYSLEQTLDNAPETEITSVWKSKQKQEEDQADYLEQLLTDSRINGKRVILTLLTERYFKNALKKLAVFCSYTLLRDWVTRIKVIYDMIHYKRKRR